MTIIMRLWLQAAKISFFKSRGTWSRTAALLHQKESVEVVQVSDRDASLRGCTGKPNQDEALGHLAWEHLGMPHWKLENAAREKDVWAVLP